MIKIVEFDLKEEREWNEQKKMIIEKKTNKHTKFAQSKCVSLAVNGICRSINAIEACAARLGLCHNRNGWRDPMHFKRPSNDCIVIDVTK